MLITKDEVVRMFSRRAEPLERMEWFRDRYLPEIALRLNTDDVRKRLALYRGDRIPENERNLTDVRNRVSLIIEYELARVSTALLKEVGVEDVFWAYVVANRFPDLEVRKADGARSVRIEVKCLQSVAEEKSANFDTLKKDINPNTDYVVVFLWEWDAETKTVDWKRAPRVEGAYVFHAHALAELRDHYWLNKPPNSLGNGYQGFDLRYAVNCKNGSYNEEEGNYGKLLRIWEQDFEYRPKTTPLIQETERAYLAFKARVIEAGFSSRCRTYLPELAKSKQLVELEDEGYFVGYKAEEFGMLLWPRLGNTANEKKTKVLEIMSVHKLRFIVAMNDKYVCTGYRRDGNNLVKEFDSRKPKSLSRSQFNLTES